MERNREDKENSELMDNTMDQSFDTQSRRHSDTPRKGDSSFIDGVSIRQLTALCFHLLPVVFLTLLLTILQHMLLKVSFSSSRTSTKANTKADLIQARIDHLEKDRINLTLQLHHRGTVC